MGGVGDVRVRRGGERVRELDRRGWVSDERWW